MASEIRVNQIQNRSGLTTTTFTDTGVIVSGIVTATTFKGTTGTFSGNLGVAGVLTYEDVANIDSVGVVTARSGINLVGNDLNVGSNIKLGNASGIVTATSFSGSGANLTGIDTDLVADTSPQLGGNLDTNSKNIVFGDSSGTTVNRLTFGDGDLHIYHNGSDSVIREQGTGNLDIQTTGGNVDILVNTTEHAAKFISDGAVELYHNNIKKFDTITTGIRVHGDEGGTAQLQLLADQGDDNPDYWRFIAETNGILNIQDYGAGSWYNNIRLTGNTGGVELYHANSKKFETVSGGVQVTGRLEADTLGLGDNDVLQLGNLGIGGNLRLYHNTSNSYIDNQATGHIYIRNNVDADFGANIYIEPKSGESSIAAIHDGAVELYHNSSKKFSTISAGAYVTGSFGVGDATNPSHSYNQGIHVHANGTGAVLHLTDSTSGSAASDGFDVLSHNGSAYLWQRESASIIFGTGGSSRWEINSYGSLIPDANNYYDIGTSAKRVRNIYTNDLNLSNEGSSNDVDGTWGNYTIQEGESDLYLINNRNGKKYKFNLTEVS